MPDATREPQPATTRSYTLAEVAIARFADEAVIFVVVNERFLTVNLAAADVLGIAVQKYGEHPFTVAEFAGLLAERYILSAPEAGDAAQGLVTAWLDYGVLKEA